MRLDSNTTGRISGGDGCGRVLRVLAHRTVAPLVVLAVLAVSAGTAVASTGRVIGWGNNGTEELGAGWQSQYDPSPVPSSVSGAVSVVAAGDTSYALLSNHTVRAWGSNWKDQLGDGQSAESGTPVTVLEKGPAGELPELRGVTQIAASFGSSVHAMALIGEGEHKGEVATWGASEYGERGNGESNFQGKPGALEPRDAAIFVPNLKNVIAIAAGGSSDYALKEEGGETTVWAWGEDSAGKLGVAPEATPTNCFGEAAANKELACVRYPTKVPLPAGTIVRSISAGSKAAYAVLSDGSVLAWGEGKHGQLGNGQHENSTAAVHVCAVGTKGSCPTGPYLTGVTQVSGGTLHALAVLESKEVAGWGSNGTGPLGGESKEECSPILKTCQMVPKKVEGLSNVTQVSAGQQFSLALSSGRIYSFGSNGVSFQLGLGSNFLLENCLGEESCERTPTEVKEAAIGPSEARPITGVSYVSAGGNETGRAHSLAILASEPGPQPSISVTPEEKSLKVTWQTPLSLGNKPSYALRAHPLAGGKDTPLKVIEENCSPEKPCSRTIGTEAKEELLIDGAEYEIILTTRYELTAAEKEQKEKELGRKVDPQELVDRWSVKAAPATHSPLSTAAPTITGEARQGQTLTEHHGSWTESPTSYSYWWQRCDKSGNNCALISGAMSQTYVLVPADAGHTIKVQETARNGAGSGTATSNATSEVLALAPSNSSPPTISGTAELGQTLTEHHGVWTNNPTSYSYQWQHCNALGECMQIAGATGQTYVLAIGDVGNTIRVQETATNAGGSTAATSAPTSVVLP